MSDERVSLRTSLSSLASGYAWVMLGVATALHATDAMARQGLPALGPFFQRDLGLSLTEVGLLTTSISVGGALTMVHGGRLSDVAGVRVAMLVGLALNGLTLAALSFADSFLTAFICCALVGLGHGPISPAGTKAAMGWFSARARGTAMSLKQTGVPIGGILGAAILPAIASGYGWPSACLFLAGVTFVMAVALYLIARNAPDERQFASHGKIESMGVRQFLANRELVALSVTGMCFVTAQLALITYAALYARDVLGVSPVVAGGYLAIAQAGGGIGRIAWGLLSDGYYRGARKPVLRIIGLTSAASALGMAVVAPYVGTVIVAVLLFVFGFAAIGWTGVYLAMLGEIAGKDSVGSAAGFALLFNQIGIMAGPPLFGIVVDFTKSYDAGWLVLAVTLLLTTLCLVGRLQEGTRGG
ncbi:MAG: MFS transporter [Chloroflexi bacterium]|nr:MFS transporter [Chloroflexota bacterium]